MYRSNNYTEDNKVNIDDIMDGLVTLCHSYKNTDEKYEVRSHRKEERTSDVYKEDTYEGNNGRGDIVINMGPIVTKVNIKFGSSGKRRREEDDYDARVDKAWRNFYAANS